MGPQKGLAKTRVLVFACCSAALIVFAASAYFYTGIGPYDVPPKSRELDKTIAESKALGLPMTKEELIGPAPAADKNAAPTVIGAITALEKKVSTKAVKGVDVNAGNILEQGAEGQARRDKVAGLSPELDVVVAGLKGRPKWYIDRDYDMFTELQFPELAQVKNAGKLFVARSVLRARHGDVKGSLTDFVACRQLARHIAQEPTMISMLVAIAIDYMAIASVPYIADEWKDSPPRLAELEESITDTNEPFDVVPALRGEFYFALSTTRNLSALGGIKALTSSGMDRENVPPLDPSTVVRTGLPNGMFERASLDVIARNWNTVFESLKNKKQPYRDWSGPLTKWSKIAESRFRTSEILALVLAPTYSGIDTTLTGSDAYQSVALAFIRCMEYRAKNHRWPSSLKEVNADLSDPLANGKPIQAVFAPGSLTVWSVGRNHVDDGGEIRGPSHKTADDIALRWPSRTK